MQLSQIFIYPIKSLGGIELQSSQVTRRGLQYDRRWMLVDDNGKFLTQRNFPQMALFQTAICEGMLSVSFEDDNIFMPLQLKEGSIITTEIWSSRVKAIVADARINQWFSDHLKLNCRAVYMPETARRKPHFYYAKSKDDLVSFADGYPLLMISQASLDDLNSRLEVPVPMDRFRPSIVLSGTAPFAEDKLKAFKINGRRFYGVKRCGRCIITCTDQQTAAITKEPLKTLSSYRKFRNKILFGMNVIPAEEGMISIGDSIINAE